MDVRDGSVTAFHADAGLRHVVVLDQTGQVHFLRLQPAWTPAVEDRYLLRLPLLDGYFVSYSGSRTCLNVLPTRLSTMRARSRLLETDGAATRWVKWMGENSEGRPALGNGDEPVAQEGGLPITYSCTVLPPRRVSLTLTVFGNYQD